MSEHPPAARTDGIGRLQWLILLRAASATVLLGAAIAVRDRSLVELRADPFLVVIGVTYALTAVYVASLRCVRRWPWLVDAQLVTDVVLVSAVVALSGGIESYFTPLYVLPVVAASVLRYRAGGLRIAVLSAAAYAALVGASYGGPASGWLGGVTPPPVRLAGISIGLNLTGFLAVALLTGYVAEGLRRADQQLARASSALADLRVLNQHVIDSMTGGLVSSDLEGHVLTFNRAAESITGVPAQTARGRPLGDLLPLPDGLLDDVGQLTEEGRGRRVEVDYERGDGDVLVLGLTVSPLLASDGPVGYLVAFQDLTQTKRVEREAQLQKRLAAVGELAAGLAHEIRNPLASMTGSIQVLRQELSLSDEQAQLMDIVLRESERLNDTVQHFLSYARPQRQEARRFDFRSIIGETARLLRNSPECDPTHRIEVAVPAEPVWYDADEARMRQVIWNLATNGIRAMPGGGHLRLAVEPAGAGRDEAVVLEVTDRGVGIAPDRLDDLFQPFRSAFRSGTGLGLAIVHRIVTDHEGEIAVSSVAGRGTTFTIRLPRTPGRTFVGPEAAVSAA